ncbi:hypothetical protein PR001_g8657 [Phytophthora rubi]|uniref:Uncharacterized protein n=1 Tax=Phytophthora rubi TaxID=129364 RepID=A0A6A3NDM5_9STRA|nr:hypothetical protein PR001_g8657 [Phytophthora rubi]KAE9039706.1 hypothetical protein PR002_g5346 [Phytophthora rubi]
MAFIEIALRVGKARFVTWSIARRELLLSRDKKSTSSRQCSLSELVILGFEAFLASPSRPSVSVLHVEFAVWRRQVQAFHTAELNADMYAEYIAIGCSVSIVFFYGNHQHYSLLRQSNRAMTNVDEAAWRLNQLYMLAFQVGLEILVDYVSIVLEMKAGIEFDHVKNLRAFLAALFMVTAVMNITISIGVYLS